MTDTIVALQHLSRHFGDTAALLGVTLSIPRGGVFGLVGENGAGKTTLIKHLLGLYKADVGSVTVFGMDPVRDPAAVLGRIGYLAEDRDLPDWMRVHELMRYTKAFYPRWDDRFAEELLQTFDLRRDQKIRTLSRGQRARAGLLIALAHRPELLILDEPSSGLDPGARQDILAAIVRTIADEGRTVLLSSHLLHEVQRVADQVMMLHRGRLVWNEPLDSLLTRHHVITLHWPEAVAVHPVLPGALWWSGEGTEWTCMCDGEWTRLKEAAAAAGATIMEQRPPSLEEVFLARTKIANLPEAQS
jgi:ABC-2 type transport system ATP-binding protein